jgi:hypothetical protein
LGIGNETFVDMVDLFRRERNFGKEMVVAELIGGILTIERDSTFVGKEYYPIKLL